MCILHWQWDGRFGDVYHSQNFVTRSMQNNEFHKYLVVRSNNYIVQTGNFIAIQFITKASFSK